ncbi:hypothetical protein C370_07453 [Cryptococcus neoformans A1-35-8]|nr:hypothetical protein C369_07440 [Cryptococcus neoformans var. grubii A5-35-17]OXG98910.1 hypothetical protein C370_07453 [Cryptococcus neoformans var. grubii A1-35-8]
MQKYTESIA